MNRLPYGMCPLRALAAPKTSEPALCLDEHCAWWDRLAGVCCMVSGADYIRAVSDSLEDLAAKKENDND